MARMPGAEWRPITGNKTPGGMGAIHGVTLHIMAGTLEGTEAWFNNPRAEASSHFGTGRGGALRQWVDTRDRAWAQKAGNPNWISIENEGKAGDALTDAQLDRCAEVLAWAHKEHGVPLQVTSDPNGRGLGHHAMGGAAWGNHPACPGTKVVAQKAEIVRRARLLVEPPKPVKVTVKNGIPQWPGRTLKVTDPFMTGRDVEVLQAKYKARGWAIEVDGVYGPKSSAVVKAYQRATGLPTTGVVDRATWEMTWSWRPTPQTPPPPPSSCQPGAIDESN
ncbi:N-acetylmuramoyl-L-alanine amidase [Microbispora sp. NPDC049633]|uniref:peptidoglycan recognition protein family protein n=1 Tax=Microbispora sp. NPDC049633 TaxID=3154355 RepID=UPI0034401BED